MSEKKPITKKSLLWQAIKPVGVALLFSAASFYLFSSVGPIYQYLHIDITFLVLPFLGYYFLRLLSRLCTLFIPKLHGIVWALILNGLAFSFFSYFFSSQATDLANIPAWSKSFLFFTYLEHLSVFAVLFFVGYTIARLSEPIKTTSLGSRIYPLCLAIGLSLIGYSLWQSFSAFSRSWDPSKGIGLVLLIGMLAVAISNLGYYGQKSKYPLIADASNWLNTVPARKFYLGALFAAYFIFIRPVVISITPWAYIIEWLIFCGISWYIFANAKESLDNNYCLPVKETDWQKHTQEISESLTDDFKKLVRLQEGFILRSDKDNFVTSLQQTLRMNNLGDDEINQLLAVINEYNDRNVPWYAFGSWKQRILIKNHKNRREVLDKTINNLENLSHPTRQNIGEPHERIGID